MAFESGTGRRTADPREADCCRPGGFSLTEELLAFLWKYRPHGEEEPLNLLDVGCGKGAAASWLSGRFPRWRIWGIDPALSRGPLSSSGEEPVPGQPALRGGRAESLSFPDAFFDVVLMECVFSRVDDPEQSLREIRRVMKPGGLLLISDLYLRERREVVAEERLPACPQATPQPEAAGRLETDERIMDRFRKLGYGILEFQDVSRVLGDWVAQRILEGGKENLEEALGWDLPTLRALKCGYYLGAAEISPLWETLRYARERSPFYREHFPAEPIEEGDWQAFFRLPLTGPEDLIREPEAFLCVPPREIARIITLKSSGSTGKPKRIFFTEADLARTADFFAYGMRNLTEPGWRAAVFMEGPGRFTVGGLLREALARSGVETRICGFLTDPAEAASLAEGMDTLIGVPSQMLLLAREAPHLRPRTVLLSADYVPEAGIRFLESVWHCRVFTHWGMSETGYGGGVQCPAREGYHLRDEDLLIEILDPETGRQVPPGTAGEIVVTTFHRQGMPLIRYRTGDLARWRPEHCPCGCRKPRLDKVAGRIREMVDLPGGGRLSLQQLEEALLLLPGLRNYTAAWQTGEHRLALTVEEEKGLDAAGREALEKKIREALGEICPEAGEPRIRFAPVPLSDGVHKRRLLWERGEKEEEKDEGAENG